MLLVDKLKVCNWWTVVHLVEFLPGPLVLECVLVDGEPLPGVSAQVEDDRLGQVAPVQVWSGQVRSGLVRWLLCTVSTGQ